MNVLIYFKNNRWNVSTEKVRYIQHGEEIEQYVGVEGKQWWIDFEEKWDHTEIVEFIEVNPTQEQFKRLEQINQLGVRDGFSGTFSDYVENGVYPEGFNHPLKDIQISQQQAEQDSYLIDQDFRLSLMEMGVM